MDDNERLVMEAKIEVLQEAISGAIIAAIVAIIGAIIALIAKFISMLKKGGTKVKENVKKAAGSMATPAFYNAVAAGELRKVRIMLKDMLLVELPPYSKTNEMLKYAEKNMKDFWESHDGRALETDKSKWNDDLMNMEMVRLITNFSKERWEHVKELVAHYAKNKGNNKANGTNYTILKNKMKNEVDEVKKKLGSDIEKGTIDINSSWFKKAEKIYADDKTESFNKPDSRVGGFSNIDFTEYISCGRINNLINNFNDSFVYLRNMSTEFNSEKFEKMLRNSNESSNEIRLLKQIISLKSGDRIYQDSKNLLSSLYIQNSSDSLRHITTEYKKFLESNIYEKAIQEQEKMHKALDVLKQSINKFKKSNGLKDSIYSSTSPEVYIDDGGYYKKYHNLDLYKKENPNVSDSELKELKDRAAKRTRYFENMIYIEKNALSVLQKVLSEWNYIEEFRMKYVNNFLKFMNSTVPKIIEEDIFLKYKKQFPEAAKQWDEPYPEYA